MRNMFNEKEGGNKLKGTRNLYSTPSNSKPSSQILYKIEVASLFVNYLFSSSVRSVASVKLKRGICLKKTKGETN